MILKQKEKGSALVAALGLIFTAAMLTSAVILMSKTAAFDIAAHTSLQRSFYINEGASTRIQWLIAAENSVNGSGSEILGETDYTDLETDRYLPDGIEHTLDYHGTKIKFTITDALSGYDLVSDYSRLLPQMVSYLSESDTERSEKLELLLPKIRDYEDSDEDTATDGFDTGDYENAEKSPLPRNSSIVFREELLYVPGFFELFPTDKDGRLSCVRLPTLSNIGGRNQQSGPSFFTATKEMIMMYCNIEEEDADSIIAAREKWFKERTLLSDEIDGELLTLLRSNFSWTPSGYYTVRIEGAEKGAYMKRVFTFQGFDISGAENQLVLLYEWMNL